jgi:ketosteroid isomerase-like protein
VREKRGVSEIEAAEALGMQKMLMATVSVDHGEVLLELEVIDIASGLLEGWERVQGPESNLMALQTDLAVRALKLLGVEPTPAQVASILASRGNETLNAYRMLTETLGEPTPEPPAPAAPPTAGGSDRAPGTSWIDLGSIAWALEPDREEDAIRELLGRYGTALEAKNVEQLAQLQVEMTDAQRASLQKYFDQAGGLRVKILDIDVLIEGNEALATFTREDAFTDAGSQRAMHLEVRITGVLRKTDTGWKIAGLRNPT